MERKERTNTPKKKYSSETETEGISLTVHGSKKIVHVVGISRALEWYTLSHSKTPCLKK